MAGSVEDPGRETSHTADTHCYVEATGSLVLNLYGIFSNSCFGYTD